MAMFMENYKNYNSNEDILHLEKIEYNKRNGIIFYHVFTEDSKVVIEIIYRKKNRSYLLKYDYFKIMKVEAFFEKYDFLGEYSTFSALIKSYEILFILSFKKLFLLMLNHSFSLELVKVK